METKKDGHLVWQTALATAAAFSRLIYQQVCISDIQTQRTWKIPNWQPDNVLKSIAAQDYKEVMDTVVDRERNLYREIVSQCFAVGNELDLRKNHTVTFSFSLHSIVDGEEQLLTHFATPISYDDNGVQHYVLSLRQPAIYREPGNFIYIANGKRMEYDFESHSWHPLSSVNLDLTRNERRMLILSARGYTLEDIALELERSVDTVKLYRRRVFEKLRVTNITEALYAAMRYQLI